MANTAAFDIGSFVSSASLSDSSALSTPSGSARDRAARTSLMRCAVELEGVSCDLPGRRLWALGTIAAGSATRSDRASYEAALAAFKSDEICELSFAVLGASAFLEARPHAASTAFLHTHAALLAQLVAADRRPDWAWFEIVLACDHCRLSEALIRAGLAVGEQDWIDAGLDTLSWSLERRARRGSRVPTATESWALVDACAAAFAVTGAKQWRSRAQAALQEFQGTTAAQHPQAYALAMLSVSAFPSNRAWDLAAA